MIPYLKMTNKNCAWECYQILHTKRVEEIAFPQLDMTKNKVLLFINVLLECKHRLVWISDMVLNTNKLPIQIQIVISRRPSPADSFLGAYDSDQRHQPLDSIWRSSRELRFHQGHPLCVTETRMSQGRQFSGYAPNSRGADLIRSESKRAKSVLIQTCIQYHSIQSNKNDITSLFRPEVWRSI